MSWAEVFKINSNLKQPVDKLIKGLLYTRKPETATNDNILLNVFSGKVYDDKIITLNPLEHNGDLGIRIKQTNLKDVGLSLEATQNDEIIFSGIVAPNGSEVNQSLTGLAIGDIIKIKLSGFGTTAVTYNVQYCDIYGEYYIKDTLSINGG